MPLDQAARGINHPIFAFHLRALNVCSQNLAGQPSVRIPLQSQHFFSGGGGSKGSGDKKR